MYTSSFNLRLHPQAGTLNIFVQQKSAGISRFTGLQPLMMLLVLPLGSLTHAAAFCLCAVQAWRAYMNLALLKSISGCCFMNLLSISCCWASLLVGRPICF